jgi:predicted acylesterase/phospholipase RssA
VIRVGVIYYADYNSTYVDKKDAFDKLADEYNKSAPADKKIRFELWVSTYDDILAWYKDGLIDVAILSPGPVAELLITGETKEIGDFYIATVALPPASADNLFASAERRKQKVHTQYHTVCVVHNKSKIHTWDDLSESIKSKKVDFLFVHPLSASGRILPEYVLRNRKKIDEDQLHRGLTEVQWTYDHESTLKALEETPASGNERVAFIWDGALKDAKDRANLRKIQIPEFEELSIPQEVVLISSSFREKKDLVKSVFVSRNRKIKTGYVEVADWVEQYEQGMVNWVQELKLTPSTLGQSTFSLQQILEKVQGYENTHPGKARVALVLSGGGAKCAYQIGVIRAIENQINDLNLNGKPHNTANGNGSNGTKPRPLDIGLVVGTSGGAINALSVALGLTRTEEGQDALERVWLSFKQKDFFRPWSPVPFSVGLIIGLVQVLLIIIALRLFDDKKIHWRPSTRFVVATLSLFAIGFLFTPLRFWASIPMMAIAAFVGVQLFEEQSDNWRTRAGIVLFATGIVELAIFMTGATPWPIFPYLVFAFALLSAGILIVLGIRVFTDDSGNWRKYFWGVLLLIAVVSFVTFMVWDAPMVRIEELSRNHLLHHLWMALTINLTTSSVCLILIGGLMLLAELAERIEKTRTGTSRGWYGVKQYMRLSVDRNREFFANRKPLLRTLVVLLACLFCLQVWRSLFIDPSLSSSDGLVRIFAEKLPVLLEKHPEVKTPLVLEGETDDAKLRNLSAQIIGNQWLKRDLIITTSLLTHGDEAPDLYFFNKYTGAGAYEGPSPDQKFPPDRRFKSFTQQEFTERFLDVIVGSATIYPVFNPRQVEFPSNGSHNTPARMELIDGGFAHNSPIEAAVAWGATHIILVEASPKPKPPRRRHLLDNSLDAFNYLFNEAQLTDARSRGKIEIFSIRPDSDDIAPSPSLCTFDFDPLLMGDKITEGWNDALRYDTPKFLRERGQPNLN